MPHDSMEGVIQHIKRLVPGARELSDPELLRRFRHEGDEAAFGELLRRHGRLVWGVCRRMVLRSHDAEDVFQATFLVLVRKAHRIRQGETLAAWLYRVAYHLALRVQVEAGHWRLHDRRLPVAQRAGADDAVEWRELRPVLDGEIQRLPEKYRLPILLCCLQERSHPDAARQLGWPLGTLKGRLARARRLLRSRLLRRGVCLSLAALSAALTAEGATAAVPAQLADSLVRVARVAANGQVAGAGVSARAFLLAKHAGRVMRMAAWKVSGALVLGLCVATGVGLMAQQSALLQPAEATPAVHAPPSLPAATDRSGDPLPAGALARLGSQRFHQGGEITSVAFSPDGKTLLSTSKENAPCLWDVRTGRRLWRLPSSSRSKVPAVMQAAVFSRDGRLVAMGGGPSGESMQLCDAATGKPVRPLMHPLLSSACVGLAFARDGTLIGAADRFIWLWNANTGMCHVQINTNVQLVQGMALAPDVKRPTVGRAFTIGRVAVAGRGGVRIYDLATGEEVHKLGSPERLASAVAFSQDGRLLAWGEEAAGGVYIWDVDQAKELHHLSDVTVHRGALAFTPDGKQLITSGHRATVAVIDVATGTVIRQLKGQQRRLTAVAFSSDGTRLATGDWQGTIQIWDFAQGLELVPPSGHQGDVISVAITPDGNTLATGSNDFTLRRWERATGKEIEKYQNRYPKHAVRMPDRGIESLAPSLQAVSSVAYSPDGRLLLAAGLGVRRWDVSAGKELPLVQVDDGSVQHARFSADGQRIAGGTLDGRLVIWDAHSGKRLMQMDGQFLNEGIAWSPDGRRVASIGRSFSGAMVLEFWECATGKRLVQRDWPIPETGTLNRQALKHTVQYLHAIDFSPDGKTVALGVGHSQGIGAILLLEVQTGREIVVLGDLGPEVYAVAFSPDGKTLATGGTDQIVRLWDVATARERSQRRGHEGTIQALCFSGDGRLLVSGSSDATALVWDVSDPADTNESVWY